jgi:hypothetical protein
MTMAFLLEQDRFGIETLQLRNARNCPSVNPALSQLWRARFTFSAEKRIRAYVKNDLALADLEHDKGDPTRFGIAGRLGDA